MTRAAALAAGGVMAPGTHRATGATTLTRAEAGTALPPER
jgi:hypothetical protein